MVRREFDDRLDEVCRKLATSRPTAVNLFWSLDRMKRCARSCSEQASGGRLEVLLAEARHIEAEDREMCAEIGRYGAELLRGARSVLTHCNAGGLATAGDGTALSVIFAAAVENPSLHVYSDETRPLLQGARLTMWELMQRKIACTLICDSAAGWVMREGGIQAVVTGADRIAANGDAANKIGTYAVSVLAKEHRIPFYIAAPSTTFDLAIASGSEIPIEERGADEITRSFGGETAPPGARAYNPAFDVTPAENIAAIITERGVIRPVNAATVREVLAQ
jgi:methylthioribose-1-phosphate isomerase